MVPDRWGGGTRGRDPTGFALLGDQIRHLFLPALTLMLAYLGAYALVMRASLLETVREDYLTVARAKGLRDARSATGTPCPTRCCRRSP